MHYLLAGLLCFCALGNRRLVLSQDIAGSRFVCTAIPVGADPNCAVPPSTMQGTSTQDEQLRDTVMQLRETILQQKETIVNQQGSIKELTSKLSRCESEASPQDGRSRSQGSWRKDYNKNTMGDLPRDPGETIDHLGKTMQSLKARLENLEQQQVRMNTSGVSVPNDLRELLKQRLGDLEKQLLTKVATLEQDKTQLYNETAAHRHRTEAALNSLLERITELERALTQVAPSDSRHHHAWGNFGLKSSEDFKISLPLRTNYLYGRLKSSLPEMYAFTVCMWLKSSSGPGIGTPFSYGVPGQANEIVLIEWGNNPIELLVNDKVAQLPLSVSDGRWHHVCVTWTTRDGLWEAYQDGEKLGSGENLAPWHPIKPGGVIILGQEQDTVGGRFDATQAFVGELSQFNMWDRVLRPADIMGIANCSSYMPGNIVPWVSGNVEVLGGATKGPLEICEDRLFDS
ncbi:neuronal pentraxin-2-like isoform X2 [Brienomyrus brachyistius]|uniref:neuronal pentraxin-2-like isoform X2 n=1 Tax=Brienomyrus brachyistius TaxID=42636 RepID=UPI0020B3A681|nr:neuronal pentraxin-2-like isoform X2 [Brienomyrus brachyistius]